MQHELKIKPEYFMAVKLGGKKAELRKNDRPYEVGDTLILKAFDDGAYTGDELSVKVLHIADVNEYAPGYVLMSFTKN